MLNQEKLYQLIIKEQWTEILNLLYLGKKDISTDPLLQQAAIIFEQEFFKKVSDFPIQRKDIETNLETLYLLIHGKFYQLTNNNYRTLIIELVRRKDLNEAVKFARHFPDEEICKSIINKFDSLKTDEKGVKQTSTNNIQTNWIEIYNRLFELINVQNDTATYYSGPRFINTIREFEPYFPEYTQFLDQRYREGKSTTRKIFYYDILISLKEEMRMKVVNRILEILKPHQTAKVQKIEELLGKPISKKEISTTRNVKKESSVNPVVFISYSWDDEAHKDWVLNIANRLCSNGIDIILDRYFLKAGKNLPHFVEQSIEKADRIIIIFTPNYKLKADKRTGGVGYEYSIMNADLYNNQSENEKIIPVLRAGSKEESIPAFMQEFIHIDIRNEENFENSFVDLLREIYNEPAIQKPKLGVKPTFEKKSIEEIEKPKIGARPNFNK